MGIFPQDAKLTERPKEIPAWDEATEDEKKVYARMMEVCVCMSFVCAASVLAWLRARCLRTRVAPARATNAQ